MAVSAFAPGVFFETEDASAIPVRFPTSIGAQVVHASQGPLGLARSSDRDAYTLKYGTPNLNLGFGLYTGQAFFLEGTDLYTYRVAPNAQYAGLTVWANRRSGATEVNFLPWTEGSFKNYLSGGFEYQGLFFDAPLVTGNVVSLHVVMAGVTATGQTFNAEDDLSVPFNTNNATTMLNVASIIQDFFDTYTTGATVFPYTSAQYPDNVLHVISPFDVQFSITAASVTGGASQAKITFEDLKLFDVVAQNPGDWANKLAIKLSNVETGTKQHISVRFTRGLVLNNQFQCTMTYKGLDYSVGPVPFFQNSDMTLQTIANAITATVPGVTATVTTINGSTGNDREIVVTAPTAEFDLIISAAFVSGGVSQARVLVEEIISSIPARPLFSLDLYTSENLSAPASSYTVSLSNNLIISGENANIENQINDVGSASSQIRIYQGRSSNNVTLNPEALNAAFDLSVPTFLRGGTEGTAPSDADIITAWNTFRARNKVDVRLLLNSGYTTPGVMKAIADVAAHRRDSFAILDTPSNQQDADRAVNFRKTRLNINSSYSGLYSPDLQIYDVYTSRKIYLPPSGYVGAVIAKVDRESFVWRAPAGLKTDLSTYITGLRVEYDDTDQVNLYMAQVNYILNIPGKGQPIFSAQSLQTFQSVLSDISIRRMVNQIEIETTDTLVERLFNPLNERQRFLVIQRQEAVLDPIVQNEGINRYQVVCNDKNNLPVDRDAGRLNVWTLIEPTPVTKQIFVRAILTRQGANFEELITQRTQLNTAA